MSPIWTIFVVACLTGLVGAVVGTLLAVTPDSGFVPWRSVLVSVVVLFLGAGAALWPTYPVAHDLAKASAVGGYWESLNGSVVDVPVKKIPCSRDGSCTHTYQCDQYTVTVTDKAAYTDSNKVYHPAETHQAPAWHDCPYATDEYTFEVVGKAYGLHTKTIASHWLAENPRPWRGGERIPRDIKRGVPKEWQEYYDAKQAGFSKSITVKHEYENFLLSNEKTLLREYSDDIDGLREARLLPMHTANLDKDPYYDDFLADKMSFVGFQPSNQAIWQDRLMNTNAKLGEDGFQGDMHVVAIPDSVISRAGYDQFRYSQALKTYWLNGLGKKAIAKNGIGLVLGVSDDGKTIKWAQAFTGMPIGNETLMSRLNTLLANAPFDPEVIFGKISARVVKNDKGKLDIQYDKNPAGIVPHTVMVDTPFKRACMECKDKDEAGQQGFVSLADEIPISTGGKVGGSIFMLFVMCVMLFLGFTFLASENGLFPPATRSSSYDYYSTRY